MSWMERAPAGGGFHEQRLVHATQTDDADKGPAVGGGTCNLPRDEGGAVASQESRFMRLPLAIAKARSQAMATRPHSRQERLLRREQFLVSGVGGGKAAGGAGRGAGSATNALLRGDDNALFAQGDAPVCTRRAAQAVPVAVAHEYAALGLDRKQR
mgnify:CR=1 FL=1